MKKFKKLLVLLMAAVMLASIFSSCEGKPGGAGGSDIESNTQTEEEAVASTLPASKYSPSDKLIALTFDDGPSKKTTNRILDLLEEHGGAATFFLVGTNIENNIDTIKRAHSLGCEIANHSQNHKNLMKCTKDEIRNQVDSPNETLKTLADIDVRLFRAPGGNFDGVEDEIGMPLIQWSIDTNDWRYKDAANKNRTEAQRKKDLERIANNVIENAEKGDIVLMHDIYNFTADLCEIIIPGLVEKGFKLVTVSDMYDTYGVELKNGKVYYKVETILAGVEPLNPGNYKVKTNGGMLNIREEADSNSESLEKISNGESVIVIRAVPGWAYIQYGETKGWVNATYLSKQ